MSRPRITCNGFCSGLLTVFSADNTYLNLKSPKNWTINSLMTLNSPINWTINMFAHLNCEINWLISGLIPLNSPFYWTFLTSISN